MLFGQVLSAYAGATHRQQIYFCTTEASTQQVSVKSVICFVYGSDILMQVNLSKFPVGCQKRTPWHTSAAVSHCGSMRRRPFLVPAPATALLLRFFFIFRLPGSMLFECDFDDSRRPCIVLYECRSGKTRFEVLFIHQVNFRLIHEQDDLPRKFHYCCSALLF